MKILVIEDDPTVGQFVKRGFEEQRWGVDLVANGDEGEARAIAEEYDVIVLDMRLPGKSGSQVLHDLRARGFDRMRTRSRFFSPDIVAPVGCCNVVMHQQARMECFEIALANARRSIPSSGCVGISTTCSPSRSAACRHP
jgi:CheY-like chemotaxis protein